MIEYTIEKLERSREDKHKQDHTVDSRLSRTDLMNNLCHGRSTGKRYPTASGAIRGAVSNRSTSQLEIMRVVSAIILVLFVASTSSSPEDFSWLFSKTNSSNVTPEASPVPINVKIETATSAKCNKNKQFLFVGGAQASWFKAINLCRKQGKQLASINCEIEQKNAYDTAISLGYEHLTGFWLGGMRTGDDVYDDWESLVTGEPFEYTKWGPIEPNNRGDKGEFCLAANIDLGSGNLYWNDYICDKPSGYVCESE